MASTPSPGGSETLPGSPSSNCSLSTKDKRYDRQLRLWGDHGQVALERSRICVIHATATATEVLKSLILPGVGRFTIVDGEKVSGEDVGHNFFLTKESIGQNRGLIATQLLLELNPEVRGDCVDEKPEQILQERPDFFMGFSLVIATNLDEKSLTQLSKLLWHNDIPLIVVRSYGLVGYIRIQFHEHAIVESHPDNQLLDLRLDRPFASLKSFMDEQNLSSMSKQEHMHTPYVVILYKCLQQWKLKHPLPPSTYKEKLEFKQIIREHQLKKEGSDVPEDEENFEEAIKAVNVCFESAKIPPEVISILHDPKCLQLQAKSDDFWIVARALKDFVDSHALLPMSGSIPDMFSDSLRYIHMQNLYREKATMDFEEIYRSVQGHLESLGRRPESIGESYVRKFCKEAANLRVVRQSGSIADEFVGRMSSADFIRALEENPDSDANYYLILRGVDRFYSDFNTLPGALDVEPDISHLKNCVSRVLAEYHLPCVIKDEFIHEICRYGGAEPHALAAFMGSCAAHEAIKLLTKQYVPLDNLFIFNTMTMTSITFKIG